MNMEDEKCDCGKGAAWEKRDLCDSCMIFTSKEMCFNPLILKLF